MENDRLEVRGLESQCCQRRKFERAPGSMLRLINEKGWFLLDIILRESTGILRWGSLNLRHSYPWTFGVPGCTISRYASW